MSDNYRSVDFGFMHSAASLSFRRVLTESKYLTLWFFMLLNSQVFVWSANNPLGVKGVGEALYVLLVFYSGLYIFKTVKNYHGIPVLDLFVFFAPIFLMVYSSVAALINYDQPFMYGMVEDRRMLSLYIYFPLVSAFRRGGITIMDVFSIVVLLGLVAGVLGWGVQLGLVPELNVIERGELALRQERASVGIHYVVLSLMVVVSILSSSGGRRFYLYCLCIFFLLVLLLVTQTRGVLLAVLLSLFLISRTYKAAIAKITCFSLLALSVLPMLLPLLLSTQQGMVLSEVFLELFSYDYWQSSVRVQSITDTFEDVNVFGHGALWLQWGGGFTNHYGPHFFLSDIGFFGTLFRYGVFSFILFYLFYYFMRRALLLDSRVGEYRVVKMLFVYLLVMYPIAAVFEFRSFLLGFGLSLLAPTGLSRRSL